MSRGWGGRKVRHLIDLTLATRGTTCHLCGLDGADSADHEPPRSVLIRRGVPNPDDPTYLYPAHRKCNERRHDRWPITDDLKADLRRRRLVDLERELASLDTSPRFTKAIDFLRAPTPAEGMAARDISHRFQKNGDPR